MKRLRSIPAYVLILITACIVFIPNLSLFGLIDWYELYLAEITREMIMKSDYTTIKLNFVPIWDEPPLFFWLQLLSFKLFGFNELGARVPSVFIGFITLFVLYGIGRYHFSSSFGLKWSMFIAASFLPFIFFRLAFDEGIFNLCIFLSVYFSSLLFLNNEFEDKKSKRRKRFAAVSLSAIFAGLASLINGPVTFMIVSITGMFTFIFNRAKPNFRFYEIPLWLIIYSSITGVWYGWVMYNNDLTSLKAILKYTENVIRSGHDLSWPVYIKISIFYLGLFPAIIFVFDSIFKSQKEMDQQSFLRNTMLALLVTAALFELLLKSDTLYYSTMGFIPVCFFSAYFFYFLEKDGNRWKIYHTVITVLTFILWMVFFLPPISGLVYESFFNLSIQLDHSFKYWITSMIISILFVLVVIKMVRRKFSGIFILLILSGFVVELSIWNFHLPVLVKANQGAVNEFIDDFKSNSSTFINTNEKSYLHSFYAELDSLDLADPGSCENVYLITSGDEDIDSDSLKYLYSKDEYRFFKKMSP